MTAVETGAAIGDFMVITGLLATGVAVSARMHKKKVPVVPPALRPWVQRTWRRVLRRKPERVDVVVAVPIIEGIGLIMTGADVHATGVDGSVESRLRALETNVNDLRRQVRTEIPELIESTRKALNERVDTVDRQTVEVREAVTDLESAKAEAEAIEAGSMRIELAGAMVGLAGATLAVVCRIMGG